MLYKVLVIGLGQIGMMYDLDSGPEKRVATFIRAFSQHPNFNLIGGVDSDLNQRKLLSEKYSVPAYTNIKQAFRQEIPDIVVIATPTESHFRIYNEVISLSIPKVIICEKPLSLNIENAVEMVNSARKLGIRLFTNYIRRCDSAVIEVQRRINENIIKGPFKGVCWYSKGLFHNGSHFLNLFQFWLGDIESFNIINKGRLWESSDPEPDIEVTFKLGKIFFLAANEENFSHYTVELIASNGRLRYERGHLEWQSSVSDENNTGYTVLNKRSEVIKSDTPRLLLKLADQISQSLSGGKSTICTGAEGLDTLQELEKMKRYL